MSIAYLEHEKRIYLVRRERAVHEPFSAVTDLIQTLWQNFGSDALRIVREPIFHTGELTEMDHGMIKVAAKRTRRLTGSDDAALAGLGTVQDLTGQLKLNSVKFESPRQSHDIASAMHLAEKIAQLCSVADSDLKLAQRDRTIGAVLLDKNGEVLSAGANNAGRDRTRHAEVNLVQSFFEKHKCAIPKGATLVTTLKPCKMCGGMIWTAAEEPLSLSIIYKEFDPGPNGAVTVLTANSFERVRACGKDSPAAAKVIESQI